jgi:hypothetical protein
MSGYEDYTVVARIADPHGYLEENTKFINRFRYKLDSMEN